MKGKLVFVLFFISYFYFGLQVHAQEATYSIHLKEVKLEEVFDHIRDISDYKVLFMNTEIDTSKKVSIDIDDADINTVLINLFSDTPVDYDIVGNQIILKVKKREPITVSPAILATDSDEKLNPPITITGVVTDIDGIPLSDVQVKPIGEYYSVTSDFDGNYTITAKKGDVLEFVYLGLGTTQIAVADTDRINVVLEIEGNSLDEIVITALGIERFKKSLAYSVTKVQGKTLTEARETNIANGLAGKVAGVNVSNTVTGPAGTARVLIRGNTSLTGDNQPLYIVDGIPIDNSNQGSAGMWGGRDGGDGIGNINPDDIESMSVLKGNTAAALYGSRASNGVIIITTKRGHTDQQLTIEINSNFVVEEAINLLDPQTQYGHGFKGQKPVSQQEAWNAGEFSWGAKLDGTNVIQFDGEMRPYAYSGNNFEKFYRTGSTITNTISLSGGTSNLGYRFAASNLENQSVMPNSGMRRSNFSANMYGRALEEKLSFQATGQYIIQEVKNPPALADSPNNANYTIWQLPVTTNVYDLKGDPERLGARPDNGHELFPASSIWFQNPYWAAYQQSREYSKNRVLGSFNLSYEINDWVYLMGRAGIDQWDRIEQTINPTGTGWAPNGSISETQRKHQEINFDLMLGSRHDFENGMAYDLLLGANRMRIETNATTANASNFALPFYYSLSNGIANSGTSDITRLGTNSIYGQLEISYKNWFFLTGSGRNDWFSSLNGRDIFYPSIGLSAVLSDIFDLPKVIDHAIVRGSWAQVGGATNAYSLNQSYMLGTAHLGVAQGGIAGDPATGATVSNQNLVPLIVSEFEVGFYTQFFENRIGIDFAFYDRKTENDILNATVSRTSGYTAALVNVGEVTNKGIELLFTGTPIRKENFSWNVSFNMSYNKSKVVRLLDPEVDKEVLNVARSRSLNTWIQHIEGLPYGQVSGFKYLRDEQGEIVLDAGGLPMADEDAGFVPFGSGVHPFIAGLQNTFKYKNWKLGFLIDMKDGAVIHSGTNGQLFRRGVHKKTLEGRENGIGIVPASDIATYYERIYNNISEEFIYDAGFVKLRELTFGYTFPHKYLKHIFLTDASISFVGRNLWVIHSSIDNVDPESTYNAGNAQGLEFLGLPQTRSYGFNVNVVF